MQHARRQDRCPLCRADIGAGIGNAPRRLISMPVPFDKQTADILTALHDMEKQGKITNERRIQIKNMIMDGRPLATQV